MTERPLVLALALALLAALAGCRGEIQTHGSADGGHDAAPGSDVLAPDAPADQGAPGDATEVDAGAQEDGQQDGPLQDDAASQEDGQKDGPLQSDAQRDAPPQQDAGDGGTTTGFWITAYIAGWNLNAPPGGGYGTMPATDVDYTAFTHAILFAVNVQANGSLSGIADYDTMAPDRINAVVSGGHAAGRPVLFSIGGAGDTAFASAIQSGTRATLVTNVVNVLTTWGFDGVDLDMEPINSGDEANFSAFVVALHTALGSHTTPLLSRPLLTAACGGNATLFASIASYFDQINLMTYDMSGAWPGWVTWHNAPIYNGGHTFPSTGGPLPSAEGTVATHIAAGVPTAKIGIGIDFYGYVWAGGAGTPTGGVTAPFQQYTTDPTVTSNVAYADIMSTYYQASLRQWDTGAQAVYLSIDNTGSANDKFISYDDEQTAQAKVEYVKSRGIGGMIIWELSGGYRPSQPAGQRDALLQALRQAAGL